MMVLCCVAVWLLQTSPGSIQKARIAIAASQYDEAQQLLERAIEAAPEQPEPRFLIGFVFYLKNDFARAHQALLRADARDWRVAFYLALTEEALNHSDAAIAHYEQALRLNPSAA